MNKKYLAFLSAILIATISACGGSQSSNAPQHQDELNSDVVPQPDPTPNPTPEFHVMELEKLNLQLEETTEVSTELLSHVNYYIEKLGYKLCKVVDVVREIDEKHQKEKLLHKKGTYYLVTEKEFESEYKSVCEK